LARRDVEGLGFEQELARRETPDCRRQGQVARIAGIGIGGTAAAVVVVVVEDVAEDDAKEERIGPRRRRSRPVAAGRGHVPVVVDRGIHDGPGKEGRMGWSAFGTDHLLL